jgi:hypothetical protein
MTAPRTQTGSDDARRHVNAGAAGYLWGSVFRVLRVFVRKRHRPPTVRTGHNVVACLGASATDARGSYDWIADLAQRPRNSHLSFYRFAEGGDLAYNGLQRVPEIVACRPDYVVILLGNNDVLALLSKRWLSSTGWPNNFHAHPRRSGTATSWMRLWIASKLAPRHGSGCAR